MSHRYVVMLAATAAFALMVLAIAATSSPQADRLLVADLRGHALLVLDPTDPDAARRIPLPGGPHELLRLPDGRIAVSLEQSGSIAVVDLDREHVDSLRVGGLPHGLALDGNTLLVTDRSNDTVRRLLIEGPLAAWRELPPIAVESWPHAVGVLPGGALVVASAGTGTLRVGSEAHLTGPITETLALSPDGTRVATASAHDGTVSVFSAAGAVVARHQVGGRPVRVLYSPDGGTLVAALSAAGAIALIHGDDIRMVPVEGVPDGLAFSSDGGIVYASDVYGGAVTAVDSRSGVVAAVLRPGQATGALMAVTP